MGLWNYHRRPAFSFALPLSVPLRDVPRFASLIIYPRFFSRTNPSAVGEERDMANLRFDPDYQKG